MAVEGRRSKKKSKKEFIVGARFKASHVPYSRGHCDISIVGTSHSAIVGAVWLGADLVVAWPCAFDRAACEESATGVATTRACKNIR